jgi:PBP1b-binding outer membrane lipoprotein LpoB
MKKLLVLLISVMFVFASNAQTTPSKDSKPKAKQETKPAEPKKTETKKADPKKSEPKKTDTKKADNKAAEPKKM